MHASELGSIFRLRSGDIGYVEPGRMEPIPLGIHAQETAVRRPPDEHAGRLIGEAGVELREAARGRIGTVVELRPQIDRLSTVREQNAASSAVILPDRRWVGGWDGGGERRFDRCEHEHEQGRKASHRLFPSGAFWIGNRSAAT